MFPGLLRSLRSRVLSLRRSLVESILNSPGMCSPVETSTCVSMVVMLYYIKGALIVTYLGTDYSQQPQLSIVNPELWGIQRSLPIHH